MAVRDLQYLQHAREVSTVTHAYYIDDVLSPYETVGVWSSILYTVRIQWKYLPSLMPWVQRAKKHSCQLGAIVQVGRKGYPTFKQIL